MVIAIRIKARIVFINDSFCVQPVEQKRIYVASLLFHRDV